MSSNPLVSVIIPLYNRAEIVTGTVESCLAQTYKNIEILVVDDGSTDNSVTVVKDLIKKDDRIKLFQNARNEKLGFTRNVGIEKARGVLITFLDSDDLILHNKIEKCVAAYLNSGADCINSPVISRFHKKKDEISKIEPGDDPIHDYLTRKIVWKIIGPVWSREYVDSIGWFTAGDEIFGSEDYEFHLRSLIKGVKVHYLSEPLSVQVNIDPAIDVAKIRQSDKFENLARKKIYSRFLVLRNIWGSTLPLTKKVKYSYFIFYYLSSLMKTSFGRLSLEGFLKLNRYFFSVLLRSGRLV